MLVKVLLQRAFHFPFQFSWGPVQRGWSQSSRYSFSRFQPRGLLSPLKASLEGFSESKGPDVAESGHS